jgi:hypothetical protein
MVTAARPFFPGGSESSHDSDAQLAAQELVSCPMMDKSTFSLSSPLFEGKMTNIESEQSPMAKAVLCYHGYPVVHRISGRPHSYGRSVHESCQTSP